MTRCLDDRDFSSTQIKTSAVRERVCLWERMTVYSGEASHDKSRVLPNAALWRLPFRGIGLPIHIYSLCSENHAAA